MLYIALYIVFGSLFVGGAVFYWLSSRPFKWQEEFRRVAENRKVPL